MTYILTCNKCGKMYKAYKKEADVFTTDFGDRITNCFCGGSIYFFTSEDWVADKIFTVKGER